MPFFKCKQCNHVDIPSRFTERAGRNNLPPVCPRCFNAEENIITIGDEVSCVECIYHTWGAGSCCHPENKSGTDFWGRPQTSCYTSRFSGKAGAHHPSRSRTVTNFITTDQFDS
jgi:hypothetical protein